MVDLIGIRPQVDAHVQRMLVEERQLDERMAALSQFIQGERFAQLAPIEQELLAAQLFAMQSYCQILRTRLSLATASGVTIPTRQ